MKDRSDEVCGIFGYDKIMQLVSSSDLKVRESDFDAGMLRVLNN